MPNAAVLALAAALAAPALASAAPADPNTKDGALAVAIPVMGVGASIGGLAVAINEKNVPLGYASAASLFLAPSYGHWYAHDVDLVPIGLRAATVGLFVTGFAQSWNSGGTSPLLPVGALGFLGVGLYDIGSSAGAADDYNAAHSLQVHVAPTLVQNGNRQQLGVGIGGSF